MEEEKVTTAPSMGLEQRIAKVVSTVFTPFSIPFLAFLILLLISYLRMLPLAYKLIILGIVYTFTILTPSLAIWVYCRLNKLSTRDLTLKEHRYLPFLLTDTVGFIRKLPTHLVESFKTTLDEVRDADVLVHVVDISHPQFEEQIEVVNKTLQEVCDAGNKEMIMVFNKIDQFSYVPKDADDLTPRQRENIPLDELKSTWMARMGDNCVFISAKKRENIDELKHLLYNKAKAIHMQRFPYNDFLYNTYDDLDDPQAE